MAHIVIVGAGAAGAAAAQALRKKLDDTHRLTIIEQDDVVYFQPTFLWLITGRRKLRDTGLPVGRLHTDGIEVIVSRVTDIDVERNTIYYNESSPMHYDYLILAPGVDTSGNEDENLMETGHNLYSIEGAVAIREQLHRMTSGRIILMATSRPFKCPPALYEMALLLAEWFHKRSLLDVELCVYTPETTPFEQTGPKLGQAFIQLLEERGVFLFTNQHYLGVDPQRKTVRFTNSDVNYDLLIYIPTHRPPDFVRDTGLTDEYGWMNVDPFTLETKYSNVYGIGDVTRITPPSGIDLPKTGAYAHFQAWVAADNINSKLAHKPPDRFFGGISGCIIETSSNKAVAMFNDLYKEEPQTVVFPESRFWQPGKYLIERLWRKEHN